MRVSFLTPRLPPAICGLADHTRFLAEAMIRQGVDAGFIHRDATADPAPTLPGPVGFWDDRPGSLVRHAQDQATDWLWVQLSGYGYSRWEGLTAWNARCGD